MPVTGNPHIVVEKSHKIGMARNVSCKIADTKIKLTIK